jgi:hypothetical protein
MTKVWYNAQLFRQNHSIFIPSKTFMYPLSSLANNRECAFFLGLGQNIGCPEFPCQHTPCHDPDFLADVEDCIRDPTWYYGLWPCFKWPEFYKKNLSATEWAEYESKFQRCRRIKEKRQIIDAAIEKHRKLVDEALGHIRRNSIK